MFKRILVHVDADDPGAESRVLCAAHLARDFHASLIGMAAGLPQPAVEVFAAGAAIFAGGLVTSDPKECAERFEAAHAAFTRWTGDLGIETEWRTSVDFPSTGLARAGAAADLIVVGSRTDVADWSASRFVDCGDLVLSAGRPILAAPRNVDRIDAYCQVPAFRHSISRVDRQIHQHLFQHSLIRCDNRHIGFVFDAQIDMFSDQSSEHFCHAVDSIPDIHLLHIQKRAAAEHKQLTR